MACVQARAPPLEILVAREADHVDVDGGLPLGCVAAADADRGRPTRLCDSAGATESAEDLACLFFAQMQAVLLELLREGCEP